MTIDSFRIKLNRLYFEEGCCCIQLGLFEKLKPEVQDITALCTYENKCKCSRNYMKEIK